MPPADDQNLGADQTNDQPNNNQTSDLQPGTSFNPQAQPGSTANSSNPQDVNAGLDNLQQNATNIEPTAPSIDSITGINPASQNMGNGSFQPSTQVPPVEPISSLPDQTSMPNTTNQGQPTASPFDQTSMINNDTSPMEPMTAAVPPLPGGSPSPMPAQNADSFEPTAQEPIPDETNQSIVSPTVSQPEQPVMSTPTVPMNELNPTVSDNTSMPPINDATALSGVSATNDSALANQLPDYYGASQDGSGSLDQGGAQNLPTDSMPYENPPSSSGGSGMKIALIVIAVAVIALIAGLAFVLTRKPAQKTSTQPVQTEQPKVEEATIEFNTEITVPSGYVLVENDCYKTIILTDNTLKKGDNCSVSGVYGKKGLSSLAINDATKLITPDDIKNSTEEKIKQAITSGQANPGSPITIISTEKVKLAQADAVKVVYKNSSGQQMVSVFVVTPKDRYKTKDGVTIDTINLGGSYNDSFSQENFSKILNNWSWK